MVGVITQGSTEGRFASDLSMRRPNPASRSEISLDLNSNSNSALDAGKLDHAMHPARAMLASRRARPSLYRGFALLILTIFFAAALRTSYLTAFNHGDSPAAHTFAPPPPQVSRAPVPAAAPVRVVEAARTVMPQLLGVPRSTLVPRVGKLKPSHTVTLLQLRREILDFAAASAGTSNPSARIMHSIHGLWDGNFRVASADRVWPRISRAQESGSGLSEPAWLRSLPAFNQPLVHGFLKYALSTARSPSPWRYMMWDGGACSDLLSFLDRGSVSGNAIAALFSWIRSAMLSLAMPVQKSDLYRYAIVFLLGGFYFDTDCFLTEKPLEDLFLKAAASFHASADAAVAFLFGEHILSDADRVAVGRREPIRRGLPEGTLSHKWHAINFIDLFKCSMFSSLPTDSHRMANYALGSSGPGCLFWLACMFEIGQRASLPVVNDYDILFITYVHTFIIVRLLDTCEVQPRIMLNSLFVSPHQGPRCRVDYLGALRRRSIGTSHGNVFSNFEARQRVGLCCRFEKRARCVVAKLVPTRASHTAADRSVLFPPPRRRALAPRCARLKPQFH